MPGIIKNSKEIPIKTLRCYENNPKIHSEAQIDKLCQSIRDYGFINPCLIDANNNVIAGHGRIMAARKLGLDSVPCVIVDGLSENQRRAYIILDNRLAEFSEWDFGRIEAELRDLSLSDFDIGPMDFDIDLSGPDAFPDDLDGSEADPDADGEEEKHKPWTNRGRRCDMKLSVASRLMQGHRYISLYVSGDEGKTLEEIKNDISCERQMTADLTKYLSEALGPNLSHNGWAMMTTGRRRHREGRHFATEITRATADHLGIPFHEGIVLCHNADRLKPDLELIRDPDEPNLILFDDVMTTGTTLCRTSELMTEQGHTVFSIIGIRNQ